MTGPSKPINSPTSTNSQASQRYVVTYFDNHVHPVKFPNGRPFCGYREIAANRRAADSFVGADLQQGQWFGNEDGTQSEEDRQRSIKSAWDCPWLPERRGGPVDFWHFNNLRQTITHRYDRLIPHDKQAFQNWYKAANVIASQNNWKPVPFGTTPYYAVTSVLERRPRHPKIAEAAAAGDPWILGFVEQWQNVNHALAKLLGLNSEGIAYPEDEPATAPLLRVDELVNPAADPASLQALIEAASARAVEAAMKQRDVAEARRLLEKKQADNARMVNLRGKRKHRATSGASSTTTAPAEGDAA